MVNASVGAAFVKAAGRLESERSIPLSRYQEDGYESRFDYLQGLADNTGVSLDIILTIADTYGPNEDFDGLVTTLEDLGGF